VSQETIEVHNRIAGERLPAADGSMLERRNPADRDQVVSIAPDSGPADVTAAVDAAVAARRSWASTAPSQRAALLEKVAAVLSGQVEDNARLMVAEEGKPLADARIEAARTPKNLQLYAGEAIRLTGATFPSDDLDATVYTRLEPVGVVGVLTPWNFPLNLASRKIGPALAAGNTVVFKPSHLTPALGDRLGAAFDEAGVPPGVVNVVHGWDAGAHLVGDERVDAITFTGSTAVGARIHERMGLGRRAQLELGGNNPVVVLADADMAQAAEVVARSSFSLTGQACTGAGRILVAESVIDELVERVAVIASEYVLGPGDGEGVTMGPLVEERSVERMEHVVASAVAAGAEVVCGGSRPTAAALARGWFYPATLLVGVDPSMTLSCEEVFGPVVGVESVVDLDDALERANDTPYGLTAAVCTTNLAAAHRFASEIEAGMVRINRPTVGAAFNAPFGGIKMSGTALHKEQLGPTVMDFYTRSRTIFMGT
jgi:alpha-ketoglutaric semialdehyde dehydrogenase